MTQALSTVTMTWRLPQVNTLRVVGLWVVGDCGTMIVGTKHSQYRAVSEGRVDYGIPEGIDERRNEEHPSSFP